MDGKQVPYELIYSLEPAELESLKTYIETNRADEFIRYFKSPVSGLIVFVWEPYGSLHLCVNYQDLHNLTIKTRYPLPLIDESLD